MKIELSEALSAWVTQYAPLYGFDTPDAFVEKILTLEQKRKRGSIEQKLLDSMASGEAEEVTPEWWAALDRRYEERMQNQGRAAN